jgi:ABC-type transporter Mla MlaB component
VGAVRPPPEPGAIALLIKASIAPADILGLCERVPDLLQGADVDLLVCDVSALVRPDAVTVDALARLQLTARRFGGRVQLLHACGELLELLAFMGLRDVVPSWARSPVEPRAKTEVREQACGVKEEADPTDQTG